jgi:hypothetical protein
MLIDDMSYRDIFFPHYLVLFEFLVCQSLDVLDNWLKTGSSCRTLDVIPHHSGAVSDPGLGEVGRESRLLDLILGIT